MTQRSAFVLRVRPDKVDAYVEAHRNVWPEMLRALGDAGIGNYTIFRAGNEMFGYFEANDLERAASYLERQEVTRAGKTRWPNCSRSASPTLGRPSSKRSFGSTSRRACEPLSGRARPMTRVPGDA